jgi:hypothetical protein
MRKTDYARLPPRRANPRRYAETRMSTPPYVHGKEGVDGSSPSEGLKPLQIDLFCCLFRREREDEYGGVA